MAADGHSPRNGKRRVRGRIGARRRTSLRRLAQAPLRRRYLDRYPCRPWWGRAGRAEVASAEAMKFRKGTADPWRGPVLAARSIATRRPPSFNPGVRSALTPLDRGRAPTPDPDRSAKAQADHRDGRRRVEGEVDRVSGCCAPIRPNPDERRRAPAAVQPRRDLVTVTSGGTPDATEGQGDGRPSPRSGTVRIRRLRPDGPRMRSHDQGACLDAETSLAVTRRYGDCGQSEGAARPCHIAPTDPVDDRPLSPRGCAGRQG